MRPDRTSGPFMKWRVIHWKLRSTGFCTPRERRKWKIKRIHDKHFTFVRGYYSPSCRCSLRTKTDAFSICLFRRHDREFDREWRNNRVLQFGTFPWRIIRGTHQYIACRGVESNRYRLRGTLLARKQIYIPFHALLRGTRREKVTKCVIRWSGSRESSITGESIGELMLRRFSLVDFNRHFRNIAIELEWMDWHVNRISRVLVIFSELLKLSIETEIFSVFYFRLFNSLLLRVDFRMKFTVGRSL